MVMDPGEFDGFKRFYLIWTKGWGIGVEIRGQMIFGRISLQDENLFMVISFLQNEAEYQAATRKPEPGLDTV